MSRLVVNSLDHDELAKLVEVLLQHLGVEAWIDETPDYEEFILTRKQ